LPISVKESLVNFTELISISISMEIEVLLGAPCNEYNNLNQ